MNFFRNFEDLIKACSSYDVIVKKAEEEEKQEYSSVLNGMMGTLTLAKLKAKRFLDQFGQFGAYMNGDLYALIPEEELEKAASRTNFSVLKHLNVNDPRIKNRLGVEGPCALIKFAPNSKFPIILQYTEYSQADIERLTQIRIAETILFHLEPLIWATKDNRFLLPFLHRKTRTSDGKLKPITTLDTDAVSELREFVKKHKIYPKDATKMVSLGEHGEITLAEFKEHLAAIDSIITSQTGERSAFKMLRLAYSLYMHPEDLREINTQVEEKGIVPEFDPKEKEITQAIEQNLDIIGIDKSKPIHVQKLIESLDESPTVLLEQADPTSKLKEKAVPVDLFEKAQASLVKIKRTIGEKAFAEKLIRINRGAYNIPIAEAKYIERAFVDTVNRSAKIRDEVIAEGKRKNWSTNAIETEFKERIADIVLKEITSEVEKPSEHLGDINYMYFADNRSLFPTSGQLPPDFSVDEYFDDEVTKKAFLQKIPNEEIPARVQRQSKIIEDEILRLGESVDTNKINQLKELKKKIDNKEYTSINPEKASSYFADHFRAEKFSKWLVSSYAEESAMPSSEQQAKPEKTILTEEEFEVKKQAVLASSVEKEMDIVKNIDKVVKLTELRKMIDPASPMFWISDVLNNVQKAKKIVHIADEIERSLLRPFRMQKITIGALPPQIKEALLKVELLEPSGAEIGEEEYQRPEVFYPHELMLYPESEKVKKTKSLKNKRLEELPITSVPIYLMDKSKFNLLLKLLKDVGDKYKNILTGEAATHLISRKHPRKIDSYAISQLLCAYKIVCDYFGVKFYFPDYKPYLSAEYVKKIEEALDQNREISKLLEENLPLASDESDLFTTDFGQVNRSKIWNDHIIVIPAVKYWIDTLFGLGYSDKEEILRGQEENENRIEDAKNKTVQDAYDLYNKVYSETEDKEKASAAMQSFMREEAEKIKALEEQMKAEQQPYESFSDLAIEEEISGSSSDTFWTMFNQFGENYKEFMTRLKDSGYLFNISWEDPYGKEIKEQEEKHQGVVSGQRGSGTFKYQKPRPTGTLQMFPENWEPMITLRPMDENGNPIKDEDGNILDFGKSSYSLFDQEFWQTLMKLPAEAKQSVLQSVSETIEDATVFSETEDAWDTVKTLYGLATKEEAYDKWVNKTFSYIKGTEGVTAAEDWLTQEKRNPSSGPHRRPLDVDDIKNQNIENIRFGDIFDISLAKYQILRDDVLAIEEGAQIEMSLYRWFKISATEEEINQYEVNRIKIKNAKKQSSKDDRTLEQINFMKSVVEKNPQYKAWKTLQEKSQPDVQFNTINELEKYYKDIAESKLPGIISQALLRRIVASSSEIRAMVVDSSELSTYMKNKINSFVTSWLESNKNSKEYLENLNSLVSGDKIPPFTFSYQPLYEDFTKIYPMIPTDYKATQQKGKVLERTKQASDELRKRRLLFFLMNREERSREGLDIQVRYDKDFVDTILDNATNETYKFDEMIRDFVSQKIAEGEASDEYIKFDIYPVQLTNEFITAIRPGGKLYERFSGFSTNASQLAKEEMAAYTEMARSGQFALKKDPGPIGIPSENIGGSVKLFVLDRITKFFENYMEQEEKSKSIVKNKKEWESFFTSKVRDEEIVEHIYSLVKDPLSSFEDLKKQYLIKKPEETKDEKADITGRIAFIMNSKKAGIILETPLERILNFVVGEVHKLDTEVYTMFVSALKQQKQEQLETFKDVEIPVGEFLPSEFNLDNIKKQISDSIIANNVIEERQITNFAKLVANKQIEIVNKKKEQGEIIQPQEESSSNWEHTFVISDLIKNYVEVRVDEFYAKMTATDEQSTYSFDNNSAAVISCITQLMPLKEFSRYGYNEEEVNQMINQCVSLNSFKTFDPKNRTYYRIEERKFKRNTEAVRAALNKHMETTIERTIKDLVRAFFLLEQSLSKYLSLSAPQFIDEQRREIPVGRQKEWANTALKMFLGASSSAEEIEDYNLPIEEPSEESKKVKKQEKVEKASKEFKSICRRLNITEGSPEMVKMQTYIKNRVADLQYRTYSRNVDVKDPALVKMIYSILESNFSKELKVTGYDKRTVETMIMSYMADSISGRSESTIEGSNINKIIYEEEHKKNKSFPLVKFDNTTTYGTRMSDFVLVLLEKKIDAEVLSQVLALQTYECKTIDDVITKIKNEDLKKSILETYDNEGIIRLLQLGNLVAVSGLIDPGKDNYYVKLKASKIGEIKTREVDAPITDADRGWIRGLDNSEVSQLRRNPTTEKNWMKGTRLVPIFDYIYNFEESDISYKKDEKGNIIIDKKTGKPIPEELKLKAYLTEETDLDSKVKQDGETDFIFEAMNKWSSSSVDLTGTKIKDKNEDLMSISDFFGQATDDGTIGKTLSTGQYRAAIISAHYLGVLKALLNKAVYQDRVIDNITSEQYNKEEERKRLEERRKLIETSKALMSFRDYDITQQINADGIPVSKDTEELDIKPPTEEELEEFGGDIGEPLEIPGITDETKPEEIEKSEKPRKAKKPVKSDMPEKATKQVEPPVSPETKEEELKEELEEEPEPEPEPEEELEEEFTSKHLADL